MRARVEKRSVLGWNKSKTYFHIYNTNNYTNRSENYVYTNQVQRMDKDTRMTNVKDFHVKIWDNTV